MDWLEGSNLVKQSFVQNSIQENSPSAAKTLWESKSVLPRMDTKRTLIGTLLCFAMYLDVWIVGHESQIAITSLNACYEKSDTLAPFDQC